MELRHVSLLPYYTKLDFPGTILEESPGVTETFDFVVLLLLIKFSCCFSFTPANPSLLVSVAFTFLHFGRELLIFRFGQGTGCAN